MNDNKEVIEKLEKLEQQVKELIAENTALKEENQALKKFIPVIELDLTQKTGNSLVAARIKTVGDILKRSGKIYKIRNIGSTGAKEIAERLTALGFTDFTV